LKNILRSAVLAASVAATVAGGMTPASAAVGDAVAFVGTAHINCFGCGDSTGTASLTGVGVAGGAVVNGAAHASYSVNESAASPGCVISGTASGSVTGAIAVQFNWSRVGAVAVISTTGDIDGTGVAAFAVTSPAGNPCGGAVDAVVAGAIVGTP
jgi:hypothetical protein